MTAGPSVEQAQAQSPEVSEVSAGSEVRVEPEAAAASMVTLEPSAQFSPRNDAEEAPSFLGAFFLALSLPKAPYILTSGATRARYSS